RERTVTTLEIRGRSRAARSRRRFTGRFSGVTTKTPRWAAAGAGEEFVSGVQRLVEGDAVADALRGFDGARQRVAPEEDARAAGQLSGLDRGLRAIRGRSGIGEHDLRPRRDIQPGLDDAVVSEGDADTGIRAQQRSSADRD